MALTSPDSAAAEEWLHVNTNLDEEPVMHKAIRDAMDQLCAEFPERYWQDLDQARAYPSDFVERLTQAGWLSLLIPKEYGGGDGRLCDAALVLECINRNGGNSSAVHAQMYTMGTVVRHGNEDQKRRYLAKIASGQLRLQAFAITEPQSGSDTTRTSTFAQRHGDEYVINGDKVWTSRYQHSDLMLLLARTTPYAEVTRKTDGLSVFIVDLRESSGITAQPIRTMINHETNQLFLDDLRVPVRNRIGEEGRGFDYILSGMNAERILIASEVLGDGYWLVHKASEYVTQRHVFGRPLGANQAVQFPLAQAFAQLEAASLLRWRAAARFDAGEQPGFEANACKLLASQAAWAAAVAAMDAMGGNGLAQEYGVERKFRETRLAQIAPISNNLILAYLGHHVLGMPRTY